MTENSSVPMRPRLREGVSIRRHRRGEEDFVVLHRGTLGGGGPSLRLGLREHAILLCADGSRDLEGIRLAAAALGHPAYPQTLEAFFAQLAALSLLAEGPPPAPSDEAPPPADRPLYHLPEQAFSCNGEGFCCRLYESVAFSTEERARAIGLMPRLLEAGQRPDDVFLPLRGNDPRSGYAGPSIEGRCAYLGGEGLERDQCALHRAGGPGGKPIGCRLYPWSFLDDGASVRVFVRPECSCAFEDAAPGAERELPHPEGARRAGELPPQAHVRALPVEVAWGPGERLERGALRAKVEAWLEEEPEDAALWLEEQAEAIEASPISATARLAAMRARVQSELSIQRGVHPEGDLCLAGLSAMLEGLDDLLDSLEAQRRGLARAGLPAASDPDAEERYRRSLLFSFAFLEEERGVAEALRQRALRICLARLLPRERIGKIARSSALYPLALIEALARSRDL